MEYYNDKQILYVSKHKITGEELQDLTKDITEEEVDSHLFEIVSLFRCLLPLRLHVRDPFLTSALSIIYAKPPTLIDVAELPASIRDSAYAYQLEGMRFCASRRRALLADEMGLGKTIQAIGWSQLVTKKHKLIIAPTTLLTNWRDEVRKWLPDASIQVIRGDNELIDSHVEYIITSVGLMSEGKKKRTLLQDQRIGAVVFDEAHAFQNPKSQRSGAALSVPEDMNVLFLTGTPLLAKHLHLFVMLKVMLPKWRELKYKPYTERYCDAKENRWGQWDVNGSIRQKELFAILKTKMIRRVSDEVEHQLPPLLSHIIKLEVSKADLLIYENVLSEEAKLSEKNPTAYVGNQIKNIQMEKYRVTSEAKTHIIPDFLWSRLKESKKKTIIWYHFDKMKNAIIARLPKEKTLLIGGDTSPGLRQMTVNHYQSSQEKQFLVLSLSACSTGLNITAAEDMYFADRGFTPAHELQAKKRAHRFGCKHEVNCYFLVAMGTYDETLMKKLDKKDTIVNNTMQEGKKMKMDSVTVYRDFKGIEYENYGVSAPFARKIDDKYLPAEFEKVSDWIERVTKEEPFDAEVIQINRREELYEVNQINNQVHVEYYNALECGVTYHTGDAMRVIYSEDDIPLAIFIKREKQHVLNL